MKVTEWKGRECPPDYIARKNAGLVQLTVFADVVEDSGVDEGSDDRYGAVEIVMPAGVTDYGSIVSAVINTHYDYDSMQAVVNNYLNGKAEAEFRRMQEYRDYAKALAKRIVDDLNRQKDGEPA